MKSITFIGPFPLPFSGTTVKNSILLKGLKNNVDSIDVVSTTKNNYIVFYKLVKTFFSKNRYIVISVSAGGRRVLLPYAFLSKLLFKKQVVLLPCGGTLADELREMKEGKLKLYTIFYNSLEQVFVETNTMKDRLKRIIPLARISVMYNFKPRPEKPPFRKSNEAVRIVFLSRLSRAKGVFVLLEAFKELKKKNLDITLDYYGDFLMTDTNDESVFRSQIKGLNCVHWNGYLDSTKINKTLQTYDIFVFPTNCSSEGFPGALIDSAYAGLPVVTTDIAFNSEIIEDGVTGLLCKPNDVSSLASKIEELYFNPVGRQKMGENNWNRSSEFDSDFAAKRLVNILFNE